MPVQVGYQPGSTGQSQLDLTAWATFDDGATWTRVYRRPVGSAGTAYAVIRPPDSHNGLVGLRLRAYPLR